MNQTFGDRLREKLKQVGMTAAELSRRSGVTKQNIGRILNNTPHSITGALPKTERDTVIKLATVLGWDLDEALLAGGHAPMNAVQRPTTLQELAKALSQLGIEMPMLYGGFPPDEDGEGFREVVERIWLDFDMVLNRLKKGRKPLQITELTISDADVENEEIGELRLKQRS